MAADLLVKRERNQVSLYKKWTIVEAYLGSGQDARTYLEDHERRTGAKRRTGKMDHKIIADRRNGTHPLY